MTSPTNRIELPVEVYERFLDLQHRILTCEIDHEAAGNEMRDLLSPYWTHQPQPWEATEIVLKRVPMSSLLLSK